MLFLQRETQSFTAVTGIAGDEHVFNDVCVLLGCDAASLGIRFPEFRDVGNQILGEAASHEKITCTLSVPMRKP